MAEEPFGNVPETVKFLLSELLFVMVIFFTPDFCKDRITEGETPPAPITKAVLLAQLSISLR